jgi:hypothetical protein
MNIPTTPSGSCASSSAFKRALIASVTGVILLAGPGIAQDGVLHEGTPVRMKINRTISSATEHQGDKVDFEVLDDVKAGDVIVVPHGANALGTITEAQSKGRMGKGGKLNVNIDYVRLPNGDKLALRGVQENKGGGHTGAMTGAMVGTAIVFWPAAPLFLMMHGKDITVPQGHEFNVYTNSDYKLPAAASAPAQTIAASASTLTNADILKLKQAGFGEQVLIAKVKSAPGSYQLGTDDLMMLKKAGISDAVIAAMMEAKH